MCTATCNTDGYLSGSNHLLTFNENEPKPTYEGSRRSLASYPLSTPIDSNTNIKTKDANDTSTNPMDHPSIGRETNLSESAGCTIFGSDAVSAQTK